MDLSITGTVTDILEEQSGDPDRDDLAAATMRIQEAVGRLMASFSENPAG